MKADGASVDKTLVVTDHKKRQAIWCQESANITKNAEALMESASSRRDDNTFLTAKHLEHVKPMFKLVWSPVLAVFSVGLQVPTTEIGSIFTPILPKKIVKW